MTFLLHVWVGPLKARLAESAFAKQYPGRSGKGLHHRVFPGHIYGSLGSNLLCNDNTPAARFGALKLTVDPWVLVWTRSELTKDLLPNPNSDSALPSHCECRVPLSGFHLVRGE